MGMVNWEIEVLLTARLPLVSTWEMESSRKGGSIFGIFSHQKRLSCMIKGKSI